MELVVEVGMKLDKNLVDYHKQLVDHGFEMVFTCFTHDLYFSKDDNFDSKTENEIKKSCVRVRNAQESQIDDLLKQGYKKVFDTYKLDFHYSNGKIKSRIQLQDIKDVGLLVYYDNPDYYNLPLDKQRHALFEELNSYGFNFKDSELGLDKLRTLYYGKEMFSKNQNG